MAKKNQKKGKKVRCAVCEAQYNGFCTIKRVTVSLNKSRHCDKYKHDQQKVKVKQVLPTIRLSHTEKELQKQMRKAELKELRERIKRQADIESGKITESRIYKPSGNEKYPLTGDLSRFKTTGTDKEE